MESRDSLISQSSLNRIVIEADTAKNLLEYNLENARLLLEDLIDDMGIEWSATDRKIHIIHDCITAALGQYEELTRYMDQLTSPPL